MTQTFGSFARTYQGNDVRLPFLALNQVIFGIVTTMLCRFICVSIYVYIHLHGEEKLSGSKNTEGVSHDHEFN